MFSSSRVVRRNNGRRRPNHERLRLGWLQHGILLFRWPSIANLSRFRGIELPPRSLMYMLLRLPARPDASFLGFPPANRSSLRILDSPRAPQKWKVSFGAQANISSGSGGASGWLLFCMHHFKFFLSPKLIEFERTFKTLASAAVNWRISFGQLRLDLCGRRKIAR